MSAGTTSGTTEKIRRHFSKYPKRSYPKNQIVIFGGENPENVYYITRGKVRQYDISYRGEEVVVNIFKTTAFFPMSCAINQTGNQYFYKTETDTTLHVIPAEAALQFIKDNPDVMLDLLRRLCRGMDGVLARMVHLMSGTARSRLAYELVIECRRFSGAQRKNDYLLEVSESDLAARSGLSRETVSREMKQLKAAKLVTISKQGIRINDVSALEATIGIAA